MAKEMTKFELAIILMKGFSKVLNKSIEVLCREFDIRKDLREELIKEIGKK